MSAAHIESVGTFVELRALILSTIETRGILLLGLKALTQDDSASHRQRKAAEDPAHVHSLNASTVIQVFGYIEAFIEKSGPRLAKSIAAALRESRERLQRVTDELSQQLRDAAMPEEGVALLADLGMRAFDALQSPPRLKLDRSLGLPTRWEDFLTGVMLGPSEDRPLPSDLREALGEIARVRHVILHRLGRVDRAAIDAVTEGPWTVEGEIVRIDTPLYRTYIAALWTYVDEIEDRFRRALKAEPRSDSPADWRSRVPAGG